MEKSGPRIWHDYQAIEFVVSVFCSFAMNFLKNEAEMKQYRCGIQSLSRYTGAPVQTANPAEI